MNDLDAVTFTAFARRFARIEQWVPDQAPAALALLPRRRPGLAAIRPAVVFGTMLLIVAMLAIFSFGSWPRPIVSPSPTPTSALTLPPDSAAPQVVLGAYLSALGVGDCHTAEQFIDSPIYEWSDVLCGGTVGIRGFSLIGEPIRMGPNRLLMQSLVTTDGRWFGLPATEGRIDFELQQRSSGAWRIVDAWPGPPFPPFGSPTPLPT